MSKLEQAIGRASGVALGVCWEQWNDLLGQRVLTNESAAMVDPEALVLASLALREQELRLDDLLLWMAAESHLLSLQRIKAMRSLFPARVERELGWFAGRACEAGDLRWRMMVDAVGEGRRGRSAKITASMSLQLPRSFMLRLRAGLGVGIKSDLLACLTGIDFLSDRAGRGLSVADLALLLGYSRNATRAALDDMCRAGFVSRTEGRPGLFRIGKMLAVTDGATRGAAEWGYAAQVFGILLACEDLLLAPELPEVLQVSQLRDLHERFQPFWAWFGLEPIDDQLFRGERFFDAMSLQLEAALHQASFRL